MIKVLSGKYKGRKLNNFKLDIIRPTQAKVKKSIFDSIISLENKRILDLFSGVGTLGIESFSRGAKFVCFVEKNYQAVKLLRENLMMLDIKDRYSIEKKDVVRFLKNNEFNDKFDVVFADPPYYKYDFLKIHDMIAPILNDGGVFCYESEYQKNNSKIIQTGLNFKFKRYGNTQVIYWRK